jgi:hypothetical protein
MNSLETRSEAELLQSLGGVADSFRLGEDTPALAPEELPVPSNHYSPGLTSSVEERAKALLGSGIAAESVAAALGVTPSRISQLLGDEDFSNQVSQLRYENLQSHNTRDAKYDTMEDKLITKLESAMPLLFKPQDILKAIQTINNAKRRGVSTPEQVTNQQNIVNLVLPVAIAQQFSVNIDNQVIRAGGQELHTMPASNLLKQVEDAIDKRVPVLEHTLEVPTRQDKTQCDPINTEREVLPQS